MPRVSMRAKSCIAVLVAWATPAAADDGVWRPPQGFVEAPSTAFGIDDSSDFVISNTGSLHSAEEFQWVSGRLLLVY
jgi:hypothetical protein